MTHPTRSDPAPFPARWSRRRFLRELAAAGVAVYLAPCATLPAAAGAGRRVIVLGAGLAGLTAAHELGRRGFAVTVCEAQDLPGGRVRTRREGLRDGQTMEIGAIRIPDVHEHTLGYVREFGLETVEFAEGDPLYYLQGRRFLHRDGPWPLEGLTPEEQAEGPGRIAHYLSGLAAEAGDPRAGSYPSSAVRDRCDPLTWAGFLRQRGASENWLHLYAADNGSEVHRIGCLAWLGGELADRAWSRTFRIAGGNDLLPRRMADRLHGSLRYRWVARRIVQDETGVTVHGEEDGRAATVTGDHLVCTIPFPLLREIEIDPPLPADQRRAIEELFLMGASRAYFQTRSRFWQRDPLGPIGGLKIAKTDTPVERLWDLSNSQAGDSGLVVAYLQSENARRFAALPAGERETWATAQVARFFPDLPHEKTLYAEKIWADDPWARGAWTDLLPGQWWMAAVAPRPAGRLHFAGEHTSLWAGWMQGAIESGKRAAAEIT